MPIAPAAPLNVTSEQREELVLMAKSTVLPHRNVVQAKALLLAADGTANEAIARECSAAPDTVRRWRRRFESEGLKGIGKIAAGRGRKPSITSSQVEAIVSDTLESVPDDGSSCWTTRSMGERHGVGKDTIARIWRARKLRPWQVDTFKLSNDPDFEEKLVDVVGLYLNPPEAAVVFSFDEKTQCQALDRTQKSLPMTRGRNKTMTHDYKRNGTTDLFAAMNIGTGEVLHETRKRHAGDDVLAFFKQIDKATPRHLQIHVVLDNLSAHKSEPVRKWLAKPRQRRWHLHFTPTSSSWLNLVEGWFAQLTKKALKNTSHNSVAALAATIDTWVENWNENPSPFVWTKTADEIIEKVRRGRAALDHHTKSATHH